MAEKLTGWLDLPERHEVAKMVGPTLRQAAPDLFTNLPTGDVLLYKAWTEAAGGVPEYPAQQIGDCVGQAHAHGNDLLECIEAAIAGERLERAYLETLTEAIYGLAREVAGILGDGDGCYGSAATRAMTSLGLLPRVITGPYDGGKAKLWGKGGVPPDLKRLASRWKLGAASQVLSWDGLRGAMGHGYPVTICTSLGFTQERDEQGFRQVQGQWGHCMLLCGLRQIGRPGACVFQSWGPTEPTGPLVMGMPSNSFWIDRAAVEHILAERDSWGIARTPYFPGRDVPARWTYANYI